MEILKGIEIVKKALWIKKEKILVISDLHLGYEEYFKEIGLGISLNQFKKTLEEIKEILKKEKKIKKIILLGDIKHEFGRINRKEWKETEELLNILLNFCEEIIITKGNHDNFLYYVVEKLERENKKIKLVDFFVYKEICFFHGHKIFNECFDKKIKIWVVGHKHPAIILRKYIKSEVYKCFLVGNYKDKKVILMPSFFIFTEGSVVIEETNLSFKPQFKNFDVYIIGDKIYYFGKLKKVGKLW